MGNIIDSAKIYLLNDICFKNSAIAIGDDICAELSAVLNGAEKFSVFTESRDNRAAIRRTLKNSGICYLSSAEQIENAGNTAFFESGSFNKYAAIVLPYIKNKTAVVVPFFNIGGENLSNLEKMSEFFAYKTVYMLGKKGDVYELKASENNITPGSTGVCVFSNTEIKLCTSYFYKENTSNAKLVGEIEELKKRIDDKQNALDFVSFENARMRTGRYQLLGPLRAAKRLTVKILNKTSATRLMLKFLIAVHEVGISGAFARIRGYLGIKAEREKNENSFIFRKSEYTDYSADYQDNIDFSGKNTDVKMLAFYLPQYHSFKENDEWWGKGFTEWNNTRVCTPRFSGHYQPRTPHSDIGYYDLSNIETLKKQAKLAKQHGIYGFCFYYYWFSGKRLMEKPVDMLLEHPEIDLPFCLCWANENWTRAWDGLNRHILISQDYSERDDERFIADMKKYIDDKRYIRINGKPLIMVYNPGQIPDCGKSFKKWRECAKELGIGEILIWTCQTANNTAEILGITDYIDAEVEFPPHNTWLNDFAITDMDLHGKPAIIMNYQKMVEGFIQIFKRGEDKKDSLKPIHHSCMMAWDNAARRQKNWFTYHCFSLKSFYEWVLLICEQARRDFKPEERFVFINAWNEWAEGTYLEPDERYGYANINTVSKALMGIPFEDDTVFLNSGSPSAETLKYGAKIAVQVHMFYIETLAETIENLNKIPYSFDCFISTDNDEKAELIRKTFSEKCKAENVTVEIFENRGRDVAPFIMQLSDRIDEYEYVCHIHSKRTVTGNYGNDWRKYIFRHLFGSTEYLKRIFALFENDENLGIIFPETFSPLEYQAEWGGNFSGTEKLLSKLGVDCELPADPVFPVGNMFWARTEAIRGMFKAGFKSKDFAEENGQVNATVAHCIERSWVYLAADYGFKYIKVMNNCVTEVIPDKKRIAFYVHYNKNNTLSNDDYNSLKAYSKVFDKTVFISNSELGENDLLRVKEFTDTVYIRENSGFDFAAWKYGLEKFGYENLNNYDELALINNSTYAPVFDLAPMFAEMNSRGNDFWGVTLFPNMSDGSYVGKSSIPEHLQSYFTVFTKKVIESGELKNFFDGLKLAETFTEAVANGEIELTCHMKRAGFTYSPYITESYYICDYLGSYCVPYDKPASLLLLGSPFIKKKSENYMTPPEKQRLNYLISKIMQ